MSLLSLETCLYDNHRENGLRVQVFERGETRELRFGNHITQSARSRAKPDVLQLDYTRAMMTGMLFAPQARQILHIGLGAGSIPSFVHRHWPGVRQRVVELNPEVIEVAYLYFDLPRSARLEVVQDDGANHLRVTKQQYDLIFLDAFHAEGAAAHTLTHTFFSSVLAHLKPEGWLVCNAWGSHRELLLRTMTVLRQLWQEVHSLSVRMDSNIILFAGNPSQPTRPAALRLLAQELAPVVPVDFVSLVDRIRSSGSPLD